MTIESTEPTAEEWVRYARQLEARAPYRYARLIRLAWVMVTRARDHERHEALAERDTIPRISLRTVGA